MMAIRSALLGSALLLCSKLVFASGNDDPLLYKVMIDKAEIRHQQANNPMALEAEAWIGKDLDKLWLKTEWVHDQDNPDEAELELVYSRALAAFWDLQVGWLAEINPTSGNDYLTLGFKGLAPYLFEVDASVILNNDRQIGFRLDTHYEYRFTQKLILYPELGLEAYSRNDRDAEVGKGLSNLNLGLRMRYEIRREFAPYVGITWQKAFGNTADFVRAEGQHTTELQVVTGIQIWF